MSRYVPHGRLTAVDPKALAGMLLAAGWRELQGKPGVFRVLESPDGGTDVAVPAHRDWTDYPARLNEALTAAEEALGGEAEEFMRALLGTQSAGPGRRPRSRPSPAEGQVRPGGPR